MNKIKDKLAYKFIKNIEESKKCTLPTFLSALGIQGGGKSKCEKIIDAGFNNIEKILSLSLSELESVDSFAQKSAQEFLESIRSKHSLIEQLVEAGFQFEKQKIKPTSSIAKKKLCLTGILSKKNVPWSKKRSRKLEGL